MSQHELMISEKFASYRFLDLPSDEEGREFPPWHPEAGEEYRSALASHCHLVTFNISIRCANDERKPISRSMKVREPESMIFTKNDKPDISSTTKGRMQEVGENPRRWGHQTPLYQNDYNSS